MLPAQTESPASLASGRSCTSFRTWINRWRSITTRLGLELTGPAGEHKFTDNPAVANLYGVPGKQFRAAVLKIPGSAMGIELVQWGEARKPKGEPICGTGSRHFDSSPTAGALQRPLHDPDGFPVEVEQSENPGADLSVSVSDVRQDDGALRQTCSDSKLLRPNPIHQGEAPAR